MEQSIFIVLGSKQSLRPRGKPWTPEFLRILLHVHLAMTKHYGFAPSLAFSIAKSISGWQRKKPSQ